MSLLKILGEKAPTLAKIEFGNDESEKEVLANNKKGDMQLYKYNSQSACGASFNGSGSSATCLMRSVEEGGPGTCTSGESPRPTSSMRGVLRG